MKYLFYVLVIAAVSCTPTYYTFTQLETGFTSYRLDEPCSVSYEGRTYYPTRYREFTDGSIQFLITNSGWQFNRGANVWVHGGNVWVDANLLLINLECYENFNGL